MVNYGPQALLGTGLNPGERCTSCRHTEEHPGLQSYHNTRLHVLTVVLVLAPTEKGRILGFEDV